jgi:hypothetical protein
MNSVLRKYTVDSVIIVFFISPKKSKPLMKKSDVASFFARQAASKNKGKNKK